MTWQGRCRDGGKKEREEWLVGWAALSGQWLARRLLCAALVMAKGFRERVAFWIAVWLLVCEHRGAGRGNCTFCLRTRPCCMPCRGLVVAAAVAAARRSPRAAADARQASPPAHPAHLKVCLPVVMRLESSTQNCLRAPACLDGASTGAQPMRHAHPARPPAACPPACLITRPPTRVGAPLQPCRQRDRSSS